MFRHGELEYWRYEDGREEFAREFDLFRQQREDASAIAEWMHKNHPWLVSRVKGAAFKKGGDVQGVAACRLSRAVLFAAFVKLNVDGLSRIMNQSLSVRMLQYPLVPFRHWDFVKNRNRTLKDLVAQYVSDPQAISVILQLSTFSGVPPSPIGWMNCPTDFPFTDHLPLPGQLDDTSNGIIRVQRDDQTVIGARYFQLFSKVCFQIAVSFINARQLFLIGMHFRFRIHLAKLDEVRFPELS
jgi:hypothetical protein